MNVARIYIFGMEIVIYIFTVRKQSKDYAIPIGEKEIFRLHSRFNFLKIVGKV